MSLGGGLGREHTWPLRVGVALPVPEPFGSELATFRERFGDPWAHGIVPHVTLVPPMALGSHPHLARVEDHLAHCARLTQPFAVELAGSSSFRPISPVVFVPLVAGERQVSELESRVRIGPLSCTVRYPFHPHVTVAADVPDDHLDEAASAMASYRARFEADCLSLFVRNDDSIWAELRRFPLGKQ